MRTPKTLRLLLAAVLLLAALPGAAFAAPDPGGAPNQRTAAAQGGPTLAPQAQATRPRASAGHVVFKLRSGAGESGVKAIAAAIGAKPSAVHAVRGAMRTLSLPAGVTVDEAIAALRALPAVEWVEPDYAGEPLGYTPPLWSAPDDPSWTSTETWTFYSDPPTNTVVRATYANGRSWWLHDLNMPTAWQLGYTGPAIDGKHPLKASGDQIKIAVLDSGLYSAHPDLGTIVPGWDMCSSYTNATGIATTDSDITPEDPAAVGNSIVVASHGTAVSGEIAAAVNNATGVTGASWDGKVVVYKIAGPQTDAGSGYPAGAIMWMDSVCAAAIMRAADEGARVISISAGWMSSQALQDAVNYAHTKGAMVVAAAGNNAYTNLILYPASADNVIAVGSYGLDATGLRLRSSFSNAGSRMDIVAPGEYVWGLYKPDQSGVLTETGYSRWTGTSMSTPIVSAIMAMLWRAAPGLSADEVWQYMRTTTDHDVQTSAGFYSNVWNSRTGYGAVNPAAAYQAIIADYPILTSPTVSGPSPSGANPKITWTTVTGRDVTYDVSVDGTLVASGLATTTAQLTGLASGDHTVTVTPRSGFNWTDSTSVGSFSWTAFSEGPVITSFAWSGSSLTWSDSKPASSTHYLSIDGGTTMTVVPESYTPTGLVTGVHTARLRVEDPLGNFDEKTLSFRAGPPPSISTLTWNGSVLAWSDSETLAHTHYLSFDAEPLLPVSGHSFAPTGLATGVHSVKLRVTDPLGNYAEKTLQFRFGPAPSITSLTWDHTTLAWTDSETLAHTHYLSIDGGTTRTVVGQSFTPTGLATGAHTARLRVVDPLGNAAVKTLSFYAGTPTIARIGGSDRYRVAAAVSATGFATASRVVLVSGLAWPDAISAAPLARAMNAPVLATRGDLLSPAAAAEIARLRATRVTIVGGTGSVSDAVAAQLRRRGLAVDRVAGADRYQTAARVAARLVAWRGSIESSTAVVVSGERFNEGIAAGAVAARKGWPLLLTRAGYVPLSTSRALTSMRASHTLVVGTPTRVSKAVLDSVPNGQRIAGATDASVPGALDAWARATYPAAFPGTGYAIVSANAPADGLTAASYASGSGTIVLLTPWSLNLDTAKVLTAGKGRITKVVIIGGPASVSPDTEQLIAPYVTP